jgi:hypothetical protein
MFTTPPPRAVLALLLAACLGLPAAAVGQSGDDLGEVADLMDRFYRSFEPSRLPPRSPQLAQSPPPCATALLAELRGHWHELSPRQRHEVELATSPYYRAWLADGGLPWSEGDVQAARSSARDTCFSPEAALDGLGPYSDVSDSEHFRVHFDASAQVTSERVSELLDWLEESLAAFTGELGFSGPNLVDDYQVLVAIELLPSANTGAFTSVTACGTSGQMAFIVINSQWFTADQRLQSLAPHELFHAIQVRYAFDAFWGTQDNDNRWWIEASAAYQERVVYPELDEIQASHGLQWTREPWRSLQSHDGGGFQYGSYLLPASIHESLGGPAWHSQLWDGFVGRSDFSVIADLDATLVNHGSSFASEYGKFIERAATMDFEFNDKLATPTELYDQGLGGLVASHSAEELPISAIVLPSPSPPAPEYLGTSYVRLAAPDSPQALVIEIEGSPSASRDSLAWELRLVATAAGVAAAGYDLDLEIGAGQAEADLGSILLDGFGGTYDALLIAASPTAPAAAAAAASWSYRLHLEDTQGGDGFGPVPDDLLPGNGCTACSQAARLAPSGAAALALAIALLWLISGRRRGPGEARL